MIKVSLKGKKKKKSDGSLLPVVEIYLTSD